MHLKFAFNRKIHAHVSQNYPKLFQANDFEKWKNISQTTAIVEVKENQIIFRAFEESEKKKTPVRTEENSNRNALLIVWLSTSVR